MHKIEDSLGTSQISRSTKALLVCLVISIVLMLLDDGLWLASPRAHLDTAVGELTGRVGWITALVKRAQESRTRHVEITSRMFELERLEELERENERLRKQLGLRPKSQSRFLDAEVVGKEPGRLGAVILVNRGSLAGVREGWIARSPEGLVGKVAAVEKEFSRVQLITNYNSPVSVRVERSGVEAVVEWKPYLPTRLTMRFIQPESDIEIGDVVVSSGLGGVYPAGLRIGTISKVVSEKRGWEPHVEVRPFVDFSRLVDVRLMPPEEIKVEMRDSGLFNPDAD